MEEILLGIDYGEKNTGLAFGRSGSTAPLTTLDSRNKAQLIAEIGRIAAENKVTKLIVGLPLNHLGKETPQSLITRKFVKLMNVKLKKPVEFVSEHGTSDEALMGAIKSGISKKRRQTNDDLSAALILKRYYRQQH